MLTRGFLPKVKIYFYKNLQDAAADVDDFANLLVTSCKYLLNHKWIVLYCILIQSEIFNMPLELLQARKL